MLRNYKERLGKCPLRVEVTRLSVLGEISDISGCSFLADRHFLSLFHFHSMLQSVHMLCWPISTRVHYPEALSHCGHGHDLISVAQLSVVNIADIRSAFVETLASEHFHRIIVDGAP